MTTRRIFVLEGYGIECEKETRRFFETMFDAAAIQSIFLPTLLKQAADGKSSDEFQSGDWLVFPGGFSFSDHFGSGTLLAFELRRSGLLASWLEKGVHLMGVCNGFQILTMLGVFGSETQLLHNEVEGRGLGFINRWVQLKYAVGNSTAEFRFPVRHGEGRLQAPNLEYWQKNNVQCFLQYDDADFDNGSLNQVAGLIAKRGKSWIVGMMPHPEIAVRANQGPYGFAGEAMPHHRVDEQKKLGDGQRFLKLLLADLKEI